MPTRRCCCCCDPMDHSDAARVMRLHLLLQLVQDDAGHGGADADTPSALMDHSDPARTMRFMTAAR